ncbi:response regulator (plasmid) [Pseudoalteromonas sp. T1lg65]|uniref:response regulator n=1 Tax=Pseudoalteromonas sp. T1lg65 TaxID=2077101 RepID=UPI003F7A10D7
MRNKDVDHGQRHPRVIIICDDPQELSGVTDIISSQVDSYRVLTSHKEAAEVITLAPPDVIIIARSTVAKSVEFYSLLAKHNLLNYPHENILLCENKESGIAFRCCIKGIFSDYFVYKPMYENYRFRMILHNALLRSENTEEVHDIREEHFGRIDEKLKQLIDDAAEYQGKAEETLQSARVKLEQAKGVNQVQDDLLTELKKKHLAPLIDQLEQQLADSVKELTSRLKDKQLSVAEFSALLTERDIPKTATAAQHVIPIGHEGEVEVAKPAPAKTEPSKVMVVEDNEIYREMIAKILRDEGHHVESVSSGLTAIKRLRKQKFSLVFMDLFMPELDGYNTTRNLRNIAHCKDLPIIALTSNKNKDIIRKWASLGLAGYITKPSTKHAILKAVEKALHTNAELQQ